jgi:hypothetical protein
VSLASQSNGASDSAECSATIIAKRLEDFRLQFLDNTRSRSPTAGQLQNGGSPPVHSSFPRVTQHTRKVIITAAPAAKVSEFPSARVSLRTIDSAAVRARTHGTDKTYERIAGSPLIRERPGRQLPVMWAVNSPFKPGKLISVDPAIRLSTKGRGVGRSSASDAISDQPLWTDHVIASID